jgi:hypothetical protein
MNASASGSLTPEHHRSLGAYDALVRTRGLTGIALAAGIIALTGCGPVPPICGPDRADSVPLPGGSCEVSWWLGSAGDDPPEEARRVAVDALESATVSDSQWAYWYRLLDDDPDLDSLPEARLRGTAYLEAVREDVRVALDHAGYPDTERVIEVYSNLSCA